LAHTNPFRHKKGSKTPLKSEEKPEIEKRKENKYSLKRRRYKTR
jgi:hypothetical protein